MVSPSEPIPGSAPVCVYVCVGGWVGVRVGVYELI